MRVCARAHRRSANGDRARQLCVHSFFFFFSLSLCVYFLILGAFFFFKPVSFYSSVYFCRGNVSCCQSLVALG